MSTPTRFTIITGASHGIGKALAEECAKRGMNLVLVALPDDLLNEVADSIEQEYNVDVRTFGVDLIEEDAIDRLYKWYLKQNIQVDFLINNAGFGTAGLFEEIDIDTLSKMVKLNNLVLMKMTHAFIPELKKLKKAHILNLGSMESLLTLPYKTIYSSTKKFNYAFSLAIREELKSHNISVSLLCPGPVPTHKEARDRIVHQGWKVRAIVKMPEEVAEIAIRKTLKGKRIIIIGFANKLFVAIAALLPVSIRMYLLERVSRSFLEEVPLPE